MTNISGQVPDSPENFYVSIIPEIGFSNFSWTQPDTSDVDGYFIGFFYDIQQAYLPIDTIWGKEINEWLWKTTNGRLRPEIYSISAINYDPDLDTFRLSKWSDPCSPVWIPPPLTLDECTNSVDITWTPYKGWYENLISYTIYKDYLPYDTVPGNINHYNDFNIESDSAYIYHIEANNINGLKSTSYTNSIVVHIKDPPAYLNAIGTTYYGLNQVEISFIIDPSSEFDKYCLIRGESKYIINDTVSFKNQSGGGVMAFQDELDKEIPYYYQLLCLNSCGQAIQNSNISSTIFLEGKSNGLFNILSWNKYEEWTAGVDKYYIYRKAGNSEFEVIDSIAPTDTIYTDNISEIIYNIDQAEFCYYISAKEGAGNPIGLQGLSQSNTICLYPEPVVHMANAFTPNGDDINDEFKPILTFTPKEYYFIVRSRWGNILFETEDPNAPWDGTYKGAFVNEGVFVYYLKVIDQNNQVIEKNGQVMVLYPSN